MYAYANKYETKDVFLLYPVTAEMRGIDDICFRSYKEENLIADLRVFFVDVADIEMSLGTLLEKMK